MSHFKKLCFSFLAAWLVSWIYLTLCDSIGRILNHFSFGIDVSNLFEYAPLYAAYTFIIVGITWLVIATPYYFICIRRNRPRRKITHYLTSCSIPFLITGILARGNSRDALMILLGFGIPACLSAIVGTFILLRPIHTHPQTL
jgi:hypothetical protein